LELGQNKNKLKIEYVRYSLIMNH